MLTFDLDDRSWWINLDSWFIMINSESLQFFIIARFVDIDMKHGYMLKYTSYLDPYQRCIRSGVSRPFADKSILRLRVWIRMRSQSHIYFQVITKIYTYHWYSYSWYKLHNRLIHSSISRRTHLNFKWIVDPNLVKHQFIYMLYTYHFEIIINSSHNDESSWSLECPTHRGDDQWASMFTNIMMMSRCISLYYHILYMFYTYQYVLTFLILESTQVSAHLPLIMSLERVFWW